MEQLKKITQACKQHYEKILLSAVLLGLAASVWILWEAKKAEARKSGKKIRVAKMPMNYVARALEVDEPRGLLKAIVDADTGMILGAASGTAQTAADVPPPGTTTMLAHRDDRRWWVSGQLNLISQTHGRFTSPYEGDNSLRPGPEQALSRLWTIYTGLQLPGHTEFLFDLESAGGRGFSDAFGLAGFMNLDVVRNPRLGTAPYIARAMVHVTVPLGREVVDATPTAFSLAAHVPARRIEIRVGKLGMADFFDLNAVGSDSHLQFMNWTLANNGAWDYAADTRGYTVGLTADFEDRNWGFRFGEGLMPKVANGIDLVWKPWQVHAENYEFELRHGVIPKKSGVVRLLAYTNFANMGIYRDQVIKASKAGATPDITTHPWHITMKYGFGVNLEQNLSHYLTAFARFGWNDGRTESFAYTEVEQTFAEGVGANGAWWHRKQDRAGVAFVSNAIKKDHQNYLNAGGLGFLLGDGHLNYGRENIVETYYTVHVWRGIYLAPGLQHIVNPGYNRDRGPVTVPSFRAHVEF